MTACELASRLRRRGVSAREVIEAHLARISQVNPAVNAIVTLTAEQALAAADKADNSALSGMALGPLHGLPVAHKDLHETRGIRTTYGSPIFRDYVPDYDTLLVERARQAGAILVGKTNTPEFGAGSQTFNPIFGATRNPFDVSKTSGGSSGGSAVALACGMVALADGSDLGGSLRNPASFCSVVGFRPSPGRVPRVPTLSAWNTLSVAGPMARTVSDVALFLSAIAGPDPRCPLSIHEPGDRFTAPLDREWAGTRLGWCSSFADLPFDPRIRTVFEAQRAIFESLGCVVEDVAPDFSEADRVFKVFRALGSYLEHGAKLAQHGAMIKETLREEIERGARLTAPEITQAQADRSRLFARIGQFMQTYEFLVLPVTQVPPFEINQPYVTEIAGTPLETYIDWMRSCYYISVTSHPAIAVPAGFTVEGLPVGIQVVGRHQADWGVLQLAHAFERARRPLRTIQLAHLGVR
jgi:amidase